MTESQGHSAGRGGSTPDASVTADAMLPKLDDRALAALREAGREWDGGDVDRPESERRAAAEAARDQLPIDPDLHYLPGGEDGRGGLVHIRSATAAGDSEDELEATARGGTPDSAFGRAEFWVKRVLLGPPLRSTAIAEEVMGNSLALPVLSPDALSSVAYGPEAMMAILVLAGSAELKLSLPIAAVLVVLMVSVGLGYRQVIRAFPHGGGSYIVASHELGAIWGLIAGAGLILDYILTVAVSVASGVAAITSAIPSVTAWTVPIGLLVIVLLVFGNLRGVRAAGALFAAPTYLFVSAVALIVIVALVKSGQHGFHPIAPPPRKATEALGVLLILKAFSSGATAMTGIEVISNAVPVFKPPQADNARRTLSIMIFLLVAMFVGVVVSAWLLGTEPGSETVLSQIAHKAVGDGVLYGYVQVSTTLVLLIAANSAVNGFPRLLYFMARDSYAPRAFLHMGDRLAFSAGIIVLAVPAAIIYAAFSGQTEPLIPLFAVGVFVAFTMAQTAMVVHWHRNREAGWRRALAINMVGAILSGAVALIAAVTKFTAGAWLVVVLIPLIVLASLRIHRHYELARDELIPRPQDATPPPRSITEIPEFQDTPREVHHLLVVAVAVFDLSALRALAYAASLDVPVLALHISPSDEEAERFHRYWDAWGDHLPLEVVVSPYRATLAPLANYVEALHRQRPDVTLTVVLPELVPKRAWQVILHNRNGRRLRRMLTQYKGIVITSVPFHLDA
jgi:amino acid transporter